MPDSEYRLPRTVEPDHYELTLTPDIASASFAGEERVTVRVLEPVTEVVLNAIDLEILDASLTSTAGDTLTGEVTFDVPRERATISLSGTAAPGEWTLHLTFTGILTDKLKGFYRSRYTDDDGTEHVLATTQFEATDARRAFPCWDEPDRKATFGVTLVVDADHVAISNAAAMEETDLGNGKRQVVFAPTMKMSTYLVAFVVGRLTITDPVDVDGVPLRVICVPGKEHLSAFALEAGAHALRFFSKWFGIPYPGDKLDMIAIPDFASGAMENLGAVTFRESVLLVDPKEASQLELQRVADVVAHEIAHMWFGDLVTMKWWNGIWLNEAFATFMEMLCVDDFRPAWERWVAFGRSRAAAMIIDGLAATRTIEYPVGSPEEADGMFDVLTYEKGAGVLRMLEQYLGDEAFRTGIRRYIEAFSYANTETGDLWDAIEAATDEPARTTMDSWIFQEGYPVVTVESDGARVNLSQQRFRYSGATDDPTRWQVPVLLRAGTKEGEVRERTLLTDRTGSVDLGGAASWVVANDGGSGFYRVRYSTDLLRALIAELGTRLSPIERLNLVNDTWAAAVAGLAPLSDFLELAARPPEEDDANVWWSIVDSLGFVHAMTDAATRPRFEQWARSVLRPAFDRYGFEPAADAGERIGPRQANLLVALGTWAGDEELRARCRELHAALLKDRDAVRPDLVPSVVTTVARNGSDAEYEVFVEKWRTAQTPQEENRYLYALGDFQPPHLAQRTIEIALREARAQSAPWVLMFQLSNPATQAAAWEAVEANWDDMCERFPPNLIPRLVHDYLSAKMLNGVAGFDAALLERASQFLASHPLPGRERQVEQGLERARVHVAFREREAAGIGSFLDRV